jgi:hypothetical protein
VEREKERYGRRFCADGPDVAPACADDAGGDSGRR